LCAASLSFQSPKATVATVIILAGRSEARYPVFMVDGRPANVVGQNSAGVRNTPEQPSHRQRQLMKLLLASRVEDIDLLKGMLEKEGIACEVTNDSVPLPGAVFYPELRVVNDADFPAAAAILDAFRRSPPPQLGPWTCLSCGEILEGQFMSCWKCGATRPASTQAAAVETAAPAVQEMHRSQTMDIIAYAMTALIAFTVSGVSIVRIARGEQSFTLLASKSSGWQISVNNLVLLVIFGLFGLMLAWKTFSLWREERKWRTSR